jgi:plastocyanin
VAFLTPEIVCRKWSGPKGIIMRLKMVLSVFAVAAFGSGSVCVAATTTIVQAGQAFSETDVSIKAGDHIKFANQDDVNHNILVQEGDDDDNAKDMGVQAPGASVDVPFDKSGKFKIRCHIHPSMKLNVDVQ